MYDYNNGTLYPFYTLSKYSDVYLNKIPQINKGLLDNYLKDGKLMDFNLMVNLMDALSKNNKLEYIDEDPEHIDNIYQAYTYYQEWYDDYINQIMNSNDLNETENIIKSFNLGNNIYSIVKDIKVLSQDNKGNLINFVGIHRNSGKKLIFKNIKGANILDNRLKYYKVNDIRECYMNMFFNDKNLPFRIPKCYGYISCSTAEIDYKGEVRACEKLNKNKNIYIITEFIENQGNIYSFMKKRSIKTLEKYFPKLIYKSIENLQYLNKKYKFTHGDFHSQNILVTKSDNGDLEPVFIDFYFSGITFKNDNLRDNLIYFGNGINGLSWVNDCIFYDIFKLLMDLYHSTYKRVDNDKYIFVYEFIEDILSYYHNGKTRRNYNIGYEYLSDKRSYPFKYVIPEFYNFIEDVKPTSGLLKYMEKLNYNI